MCRLKTGLVIPEPKNGVIDMPDERIPLVSATRELKAITVGRSPPYQHIWKLIANGDLPAEQINGRWFIKRADLPAIAKLLGLLDPDAPRRGKKRNGIAKALAAAAA